MSYGSFYQWYWSIFSKALPTVYDDTLSYYEVLCKLIKAMGNFAEVTDELTTKLEDLDTAVENAEASAEAAAESATQAEQAVASIATSDVSEAVVFNTDYFASATVTAKKYGNVVTLSIQATVKAGVTQVPKNTALFTVLPWKSNMSEVLWVSGLANVETLNDVNIPVRFKIQRTGSSASAEAHLGDNLTCEGGNKLLLDASYILN